MKQKFGLIVLVIIMTAMLGACKPQASANSGSESITVTDDLGREVTLAGPAQRIISLAPSNTEILFAIGAGAQVIARDDFSDYPAEVKDLPSIGGNFNGYNMEAIAGMKPDLVLAAELNTPEQVKAFEDLGIPVVYIKNPAQLMDGLYTNIRLVATLSGQKQNAEALIQTMMDRVQKVKTALANVTSRPMVYYELDATDPSKPYTFGPGTFIDILVQMAGGTNFGSDLQEQYVQISQEDLLVKNPGIIILGDSNYGTTVDQVAQRPGWDALTAVQDGKVYPIDDNIISRPSPRMVDGLVALVKILHPEIADQVE